MAQDKLKKTYDAVIIGSGASGGLAAKELTERGIEVLVLEAGPPVDPARDFSMHTWPYEDMYRGFGPPGWKERDQWMQNTAAHFSRHFYVKDTEHPYTTDPGKPFHWIRARIVGGKTLHWGRLSWRIGDIDFKAASTDGFDVDWPISYADLEPYYDRVEEFIGVSGNRDGLEYLPDGKFLPPMNLTCGEQLLKKGAEKTGRKAIVARVSMLTQTAQGAGALPLLRPLRRRVRRGCDVQFRSLDASRCPGYRSHDAAAQFSGAAHYCRHEDRPCQGRGLRRSGHLRGARGARTDDHSRSFDARVDADTLELEEPPASQRAGEFLGRPGPLSRGSLGRHWRCRVLPGTDEP